MLFLSFPFLLLLNQTHIHTNIVNISYTYTHTKPNHNYYSNHISLLNHDLPERKREQHTSKRNKYHIILMRRESCSSTMIAPIHHDLLAGSFNSFRIYKLTVLYYRKPIFTIIF